MKVKRISARDTLPIRQKILRLGKPEDTCVFKDDERDQTFHLGAFVDKKLVSIASFYFHHNDTFNVENQYQLRGMATLEQFQRQGFSTELLKVAFPMVKQNFCDIIWCNARIEARDFYEQLGFVAKGEEFDIPDVGKHILMCKEL